MSESPDAFNPYQPPAVLDEPDVRMAEDTEFLISDREILCRNEVTLPKLCIHTGDPDDLEVRQQVFHSVTGLAAIGIIAGLMGLVVFSAMSSSRWGFVIVIVVVAGGVFLQSLLVRFRVPGLLTVDATWYVGRRYLERARRRARLMRLGLVAVIGSGCFIAASENSWSDVALVTAIGIAVSGILSLMISSEKRLQFSGRRHFGVHKGLMVLTGHSRHFAAAVNRVIHGF